MIIFRVDPFASRKELRVFRGAYRLTPTIKIHVTSVFSVFCHSTILNTVLIGSRGFLSVISSSLCTSLCESLLVMKKKTATYVKDLLCNK